MNKAIIVFFLILIIPVLNIKAQEDNRENETTKRNNIDFSLLFGMNFTTLTGDTDAFEELISVSTGFDFDEKWRTFTVPVGIALSLNTTSWLSFKTAVMYSPKGMKFIDNFDLNGDDYDLKVVLKLRYIEVPCLAEFNIATNRNSVFYVSGGITSSFLVDSKISTKVKGPNESDEEREDWKDVNKFDLGYQVGTGFKTDDGYFGVQFVKGFKNVSSADWNFSNVAISIIFGGYF